ncbi:L-threonylcarbamoyladenylate synthase [Planctomycetes bacterium K23_9]|uniref:L-threonylcarbamoyladenylate synthase n=1 Tax=Stieleria marina TaxID=1930275 RepID=A0A517NQH9_9BACT|nr:Threonylcarbamoyl-AMP synthase [Planctomycetes bacterium K23_9]
MVTVLDLQTSEDPRDIVHRTVQALVEGQVVGVPTDTVYGLAAHALCEDAVDRLCEIKGRDQLAPLAISVRSRDAAGDLFGNVSPLARRLSQRCWPGPVTMVTPCDTAGSAIMQLPLGVRQRIMSEGNCVGFRVVDHRILSYIHRFLAAPLVLTSANVSGKPAQSEASGVVEQLGTMIPLLLDDGPTRYGGASTVVRVRDNRWELLREGVIERAAMNQFTKPVIALVCTGNTCRSPMAETLLREKVREQFGSEDAVRVLSAGVAAGAGSGASPQAVEVMGERGLDLTGHSSQQLDDSILNVADLILTMTRGHQSAILAAWPNMHDRVFTLRHDGGDISDPVGRPVEVYQQCADQIDQELTQWLQKLGDNFLPETTDSQEGNPSNGQSEDSV